MNKLRVIDLLNKIADGKAPKKIKINEHILNLKIGKGTSYEFETGGGELNFNYYIENNKLDTIVEIMEENKKIRKIKVNYSPDIDEEIFYEDGDKPNHCVLGDAGTKLLINKINEIIDYIMEDKHE